MAIIVFFVVAIHLHQASSVNNGKRLSGLMRAANWFLVGVVYIVDAMIRNHWLIDVSDGDLPPLFVRALFRFTFLLLVIGEVGYYGDTVADMALNANNNLKRIATNIALTWNRLIRH